ncbi:major facilitator superfamily domain-containing protein [Limtongia smithiae]|uniref:major facilitator superfamily domain-containing protein n=1 Tax=Limtongia smithiae TaxID=1125753 RepID=UPI0034CD6CB6
MTDNPVGTCTPPLHGKDKDGMNNNEEPSTTDKTASEHTASDLRVEVEWGPNDPQNPMNLSLARKWTATWITSIGALCVAVSSSIYSTAFSDMETEFGVNQTTAIAGMTVFNFGMGFGPMIYSPLSEFYGRRIIYLFSFFFYLAFQFPIAFAPNIVAVLVNRLLCGLSGSAFLSVAGGTVSDIFPKSQLGRPMMVFTAAPFLGPCLGPLIGDFIAHGRSWRWVFYVMIMWTFIMLMLICLFVPETYSPVLLRWRAQKLRKETGNQGYYAEIEVNKRSRLQTIFFSIKRPFQLLFLEIMVFCLCLYTAVLLGVMYLFFEAFPLVFKNNHNFQDQYIGLTFLGLLVGILGGVITEPYWRSLYTKLALKKGIAEPEFRLPQAIFGSLFVPVGMFWFSFTTYSSVPWIVPILAGIPFGFGMILVFSGVFTYLVEAYQPFSASALAANCFIRNTFAAAFPLFAVQMFNGMGYVWAPALLSFIILFTAPSTFLFYKYGKHLRERSKFAWTRPELKS